MDRVTPEKDEAAFLRWQRDRIWRRWILWLSPLLIIFIGVYPFFFFTQQAQVPVAQGPEVLVLVTQVQERQVPETQVLEIQVSETQLQEIQPRILEIRIPVTQWLSRQVPETQVLKPEMRWLVIQVPVAEWLKRQVPEMQWLEIQVPVAEWLKRQVPETQWLGIQVPVAQLREIQGTEALVLVAQVPGPEIALYVIVGICIAYCAVPLVVHPLVIKPRLRELAKDAAVFAALVAAEDLERGNPVRASLSMDKLLAALSHFLEQKLVALGLSAVPPRGLMHVTPAKIPRGAVFQAVQAREDTKDFQESLRNLAIGLRCNADAAYLAAYKFLVWLNQQTESSYEAPRSFFDKHPALKTITVSLGPPIVAAIGGIVVLVL